MGRDYGYMVLFWNFMSFHVLVVSRHMSKIRPFPGGRKSSGTKYGNKILTFQSGLSCGPAVWLSAAE